MESKRNSLSSTKETSSSRKSSSHQRRRKSIFANIPPARRQSSAATDSISREISMFKNELGSEDRIYFDTEELSALIRRKQPSLGSLYILPNPNLAYTYKLANPDEARYCFRYLTLSQTGVNEFLGVEVSFHTLEKWMEEASTFERLKRIPFFSQFRVSKAFRTWNKSVRRSKFNSASKCLFENSCLWGKDSSLRSCLCRVMALMSQLTDMGVTTIDPSKTYKIEEFFQIQSEQVETFKEHLKEFSAVIKRIVLDACKTTFSSRGFQYDDYRMEIEAVQHQRSLTSSSLSTSSNQSGKPRKLTFIEQSNKRRLCEHLVTFLRLTDLIFRITLHKVVLNSLTSVFTDMESRSLDVPMDSKNNSIKKEETLVGSGIAMFHVVASVHRGLIRLGPTIDDFGKSFTGYLNELNSAISNVELLLDNEDFRPFTKPYLYGKIVNFNETDFVGNVIISSHEEMTDYILEREILATLIKSYKACDSVLEPHRDTSAKFYESSTSTAEEEGNEDKDLKMSVATDVEQLKAEMHSLTSKQKNVRELKDYVVIGLFRTDFRPLKRLLLPNIAKAFTKLQEALPKLGREKIRVLNKRIKEVGAFADFEPESAKDMVANMDATHKLEEEYRDLELKYSEILKVFAIMEKIPLPIPPEDGTAVNNLKASMTSLQGGISKRKEREKNKTEKLRKRLNKEKEELKIKISTLLSEIQGPNLLDINVTPEETKVVLVKLRNELGVLTNVSQIYKSYEETYGFEVTVYDDILIAQNILSSIERLWQCSEDWDLKSHRLYSLEFDTLDVESSYEYTLQICESISEIRESLGKDNEVILKLEEEVMSLKSKIPCIRDLRSSSLKPHHWKIISELIGVDFEANFKDLTLELLDQYGAYAYHKDIHKITKNAVEEEKLDNHIRNLNNTWTTTRVETKVCHGILIVDGFDFLYQTLDYSFATLRQLGLSGYVDQFKERLLSWSERLEFVQGFIELLQSTQNLWSIQEVPFSCMMLKEELPAVSQHFGITRLTFYRSLKRIIESSNLLSAFTDEVSWFLLTDAHLHFTKLKVYLTDALKAVRSSSPRLFFLGDEDLLNLFESSINNIFALESYLPKMFTSFRKILIADKPPEENYLHNHIVYNPMISGVVSKDGETVLFEKPVKARLDSPHWIKTIDTNIHCTLQSELQAQIQNGLNPNLFEDVWQNNKLLSQTQRNLLHILWSKDPSLLNIENLKAYCVAIIRNSESNSKMRAKEVCKLLQLIYYESHPNLEIKYIFKDDQLHVCGSDETLCYGKEYLGNESSFNPELHSVHHEELFTAFGTCNSKNMGRQKMLASILGRFYVSLSYYDKSLQFLNIIQGTLKLSCWAFFRDFDCFPDKDILYLKEIYILTCFLKKERDPRKTFLFTSSDEIPIGMSPRIRFDALGHRIGRSLISLVKRDFKFTFELELRIKGITHLDGIMTRVLKIQDIIKQHYGSKAALDFEQRILNGLRGYEFLTELDFVGRCAEKVNAFEHLKGLNSAELNEALGDEWMKRIRAMEEIKIKMNSSFDVTVINATELQSSVDSFVFTIVECEESFIRRKSLSMAQRHLKNQGYKNIFQICPVTQNPNDLTKLVSNCHKEDRSTLIVLNGPINRKWKVFLERAANESFRFILTSDDEDWESKRIVWFHYDPDVETRLIAEKFNLKEDCGFFLDACRRVSDYLMKELKEYAAVKDILIFAIASFVKNRSPYKSIFISGAFHIFIKKSLEKFIGFFKSHIHDDIGLDDPKDPFDAQSLNLKLSLSVNDIEPEFYVPSREQSKTIQFLKSCFESKLSVLLCGLRGSGKSRAVKEALKHFNDKKYELLTLNMSCAQKEEEWENFFEKEGFLICERMIKSKAGANAREKTLLLILEAFDAENPKDVYFLRSIKEGCRLFFNEKTKCPLSLPLENIVVCAEATLQPNVPFVDMATKIKRKICDIIPFFHRKDDNENEMVAKTVLDQFLTDFEKDVSESSSSVCSLVNSIHEIFKSRYPDTVSDHNLFRVLNGILYADPEILTKGRDFGNHVYNEVKNEYFRSEDVTYRKDEEIIDSKFLAKRGDQDVSSYKESISFFYFEEGKVKIQMISLKEATKKFTSAYSAIRGKVYNNRVVFSNSFSLLIANIIRSINKYGHVLMSGKPGRGRKTVAEFSSYFLGINFIEVPSSYDEFIKKLHNAYKDASNGDVYLLLLKLNKLDEDTKAILTKLEEILYYGECYGLLSVKERRDHLFDSDSQQYEANYDDGVLKEAKKSLYHRIRDNLHFFICADSKEVLRYILKCHPYLSQQCGYHEIDHWNEETLIAIAEDRFQGTEFDNLLRVSSTVRSLAIVSAVFHSEASQRLSTPSYMSYLDAVKVLPQIYISEREELVKERAELSTGVSLVSEANEYIHKLGSEISGEEPEISRLVSEIERLQKRLSQEKASLEKASKAFRKKEVAARKKSEETKELAADAHRNLERALPGLETALAGLHSIDKNDIYEMKTFKSPPEGVQQVMEAVSILLGHKADWNTAKVLLGDYSFLQKLLEFDKDNINEQTSKRIRRYIDNPKFTPDEVGKTSKAASNLCLWVRAIDLYAQIFKSIEPKRIKLLQSESELAEAMAALRAETDRVAHIESTLTNVQGSLQDRIKRKETLEKNLAITSERLERAELLSYSLEEECRRWKSRLKETERKISNLLGDSLISAFTVGFCGGLLQEGRTALRNSWRLILDRYDIPYSTSGKEPNNIHWFESEHYQQNAMISKHTNRWSFFVDPNNTAFEALEIKGLRVLKTSNPDFQARIRTSLTEGATCVVKDFGFDYSKDLKNVFERNLFEKVRVFVGLIGIPKMRKDIRVKIGPSNDEIAVGNKFRLYLHSEDEKTAMTNDKVNVISYVYTREAFFLKLRSELMLKFDPAFSKKHQELSEAIKKNESIVDSKVKNVLDVFIKSKDSMLDDGKLVSSLKDAKAGVFEHVNELNALKKALQDHENLRYSEFSEKASKLTSFYILIEKFVEEDPTYIFTPDKIRILFSETATDVVERIMCTASLEFIHNLHVRHRDLFKMAVFWIQTLPPTSANVFIDEIFDLKTKEVSLGEEEIRRKLRFDGELNTFSFLDEIDVFHYISTNSASYPILLLDESSSEEGLEVVIDLLKSIDGSLPLRYFALSKKRPLTSTEINDAFRIAKRDGAWVFIDGIQILDATLNKIIIPKIGDSFRVFLRGNHGYALNSRKVLSNFKTVSIIRPESKVDYKELYLYCLSRLRLWKKDIYRPEFFARILVENAKEGKYDLKNMKALIQRLDAKNSLDMERVSDLNKELFDVRIELSTLRTFI